MPSEVASVESAWNNWRGYGIHWCHQCNQRGECRIVGMDVICKSCWPECTECGKPRYEGSEGTLCIDCEIQSVWDAAQKGDLTQHETFEWIHELEEARRAA